jgi:hypothetical protein
VAGAVLLAEGAILASCREQPPAVVRETPETQITPTVVSIEPSPTQPPTPEPTIGPTPTVINRPIGTIPRELGGAESRFFNVSYNGETQLGAINTFPDGTQWFVLGVYPDLPEVEEQVDFANEVVGYDGEVFLTAISALKEHPGALPFYQAESTEGFPNGALLYVEDGEVVAQVDPFERLQENEVSIRFDAEKGRYEFLDAEGNATRTEEVFMVPEPTPEPTPEPAPTQEPEEPQVYRVVAEQITGYTEPDGEEVGYVVRGKTFTILEEQDGWIRVQMVKPEDPSWQDGWVGWMRKSETAYILAEEPWPEPPPPTDGPMIPESDRISPAKNPIANRDNGLLELDGNIFNVAGDDRFGTIRRIRPDSIVYPGPLKGAWRSTGNVVGVDYKTGKITIDIGGGRRVIGILGTNAPFWCYYGNGEWGQGNIYDIKPNDNINFSLASEEELRALFADPNLMGQFVGVEGVR